MDHIFLLYAKILQSSNVQIIISGVCSDRDRVHRHQELSLHPVLWSPAKASPSMWQRKQVFLQETFQVSPRHDQGSEAGAAGGWGAQHRRRWRSSPSSISADWSETDKMSTLTRRIVERFHTSKRLHSNQGIHTNKGSFERWEGLTGVWSFMT